MSANSAKYSNSLNFREFFIKIKKLRGGRERMKSSKFSLRKSARQKCTAAELESF